MTALTALLKELIGLFVDDGALALAIAAIVVLAGISAAIIPGVPAVPGAILSVGCLAALFVNVMRSGRS